MMVAPVQRAAIHGATISLLLQSVTCAGGRDFDGLLLGRFQTHTETRFEDECSDAIVVEQHHALVTGVVCSATSCSFYDASGAITEEQLQALVPTGCQDQVIGWLSYRAGSALHPSMREAAVTCSLYARAAKSIAQQPGGTKLPPALLLVASSNNADHGGATTTFEYRLFQAGCASSLQLHQSLEHAQAGGTWQPSVPVRLTPVDLVVENLAQGLGHHSQYKSFQPFMRLPKTPGTAEPGQTQGQVSALEAVAAASGQQVVQLEAHCNELLRQLQALSRQVSEEATSATSLAEENRKLHLELLALTS